MIRPYSYRFKTPLKWDAYVQALIEHKVGVRMLGATETSDEVILFFERELNEQERKLLASLMENPPYPEHRFEVKELTKDDIERIIGVRPVLLSIDFSTGRIVRIAFEKKLSPEQVSKLKDLWRNSLKLEEV